MYRDCVHGLLSLLSTDLNTTLLGRICTAERDVGSEQVFTAHIIILYSSIIKQDVRTDISRLYTSDSVHYRPTRYSIRQHVSPINADVMINRAVADENSKLVLLLHLTYRIVFFYFLFI